MANFDISGYQLSRSDNKSKFRQIINPIQPIFRLSAWWGNQTCCYGGIWVWTTTKTSDKCCFGFFGSSNIWCKDQKIHSLLQLYSFEVEKKYEFEHLQKRFLIAVLDFSENQKFDARIRFDFFKASENLWQKVKSLTKRSKRTSVFRFDCYFSAKNWKRSGFLCKNEFFFGNDWKSLLDNNFFH